LDTNTDYYALLGVKRAASPDEIKRAYRQMVFRYHPDRNPGDNEAAGKFKQVLDAYGVLSDGEKRSVYDSVTKPAEAEPEPEESVEEEKPQFGDDVGNGFRFSQEFKANAEAKAKTQAEPKCPSCAVVGSEHVLSRRGGAPAGRGKQFILAPFNIVFCDSCGHVYGVTPNSA
jgi:DnaJ-class molecular chaperone